MPDPQDELRRLINEALRFDLQSRQMALIFDEELARVWRLWSRAIEELLRERVSVDRIRGGLQLRAGEALGLRQPLRAALQQAGFDSSVAGSVLGATQRWLTLFPDTRLSVEGTVRALQQLATTDLLAVGDSAAISLWRALAQALLTPRPISEILTDLEKSLDRTRAQAATLFDTQMTIFGRQVEAAQTEALGPEQPFLYVGPVDAKTRDWCLDRVGQVFTRHDIDQMDNEQLPNVFLTGGGYNCRHTWMAVESQALRDLAGTGERAEGFQRDVTRVRARKAA